MLSSAGGGSVVAVAGVGGLVAAGAEGGRLGLVLFAAVAHHLDLHSFPTRRSSDLESRVQLVADGAADREGVVGAGDAGGVVCLAAQGGLVAAAVDRVAAVEIGRAHV